MNKLPHLKGRTTNVKLVPQLLVEQKNKTKQNKTKQNTLTLFLALFEILKYHGEKQITQS